MASTPVRHVRIPDAEWHALQAAATAEGLTAAIVIRQAVRKYLASRDPALGSFSEPGLEVISSGGVPV